MVVVTDGLEPGERIIIDGLQKVRAGIEVNPVPGQVDPTTGALLPPETGDQTSEEPR